MSVLKKTCLLLISLFLIQNSGYCLGKPGTDKDPDTLYKRAANAKNISEGIALAKQACNIARVKNDNVLLVKGLNLISEDFWEKGMNDSAKRYGAYALTVSEKYKVKSFEGDTWVILGIIDYSQSAYDSAIVKYQTAISYYQANKKYASLANTYKDIGICESMLSRNVAAVTDYMRGIKLFENLKDSVNLASSFNSVALCFVSMKDFPKAIWYNFKALTIRQRLRLNNGIAQSYNNIGFAYKEYHKPDSAIKYLSKSVELYDRQPDSSLLILPLQNLGSALRASGNLKTAGSDISRSLRIASNYRQDEAIARGNLDLAELYMAQENYKQALPPIKITENTASRLKMPELLMDTYTNEVELYRLTGNYKEALLYSDKKDKIRDSLFNVEKEKDINELEIKYQTSQKEKDIAGLHLQNKLEREISNQQRLRVTILLTCAALLLLMFGTVYRSLRIENRANKRINVLMHEVHHRTKNNLAIISGLFTMQMDSLSDEYTKNVLRENESRIVAMNLIHKQLFMDSSTTLIEIREYLVNLLHHIKDAFDGSNGSVVEMEINIDTLKLEADKAVAIGLIVNELSTNSFKHAFNGKPGRVTVSLNKKDEKRLLLTFSDNGIGLSQKNLDTSGSFGFKLVNLMARQLNSEIVTETSKGTTYRMEFVI